ncbi:type 2 lanthipeptide synthetase LanM family protein [Kitasatospora sp. NPDC101801]|uniref:type 2 lanthipeptide synthetase LanM family protein n=1 Tax=Kitasatospora sp. NPDC101801 TaxID=3364103 RepID=UPI003803F8C8
MTETAAWWAKGVSLAERMTGGRPRHAQGTALVSAWLADYPSGSQFRQRLAELGLTENDLHALAAEPADQLVGRIERPAWVATVEQALSAAPLTAPLDPVSGWQQGFATVLAPFVERAAARLPAPAAELRRCFSTQLSAALVALARRSLVLELNVARVTGRLAGETPQQRFADFLRGSSTRAGLRALVVEYPVLARLLAQQCERSVEVWAELLARYEADRPALVETLLAGTDPGPLVEVRTGSGDPHEGGRTVALLRFASGATVVYKPRPLAVHRHFNEVAQWYGARLPGLGPRTLAVVERPGYGWVEYVTPAPCTSRAQVRQFYQRLGALLALFHGLGGTDLHVENLIACAGHPVPIDLETLLQPTLAGTTTDDPALAALEASVRGTALLPALLTGEQGTLDVSALGGDRGAPLPDEIPGWDAPDTDEMRLIRTTGVFRGAANRPQLDGADADPVAYTEDLVAGFRLGYDVLIGHRSELCGPEGLLARFAADETRVVLRATRWYAALLEESTHPDVLYDALDRDRVFDALWRESAADQVLRPLVAAELACLWEGDVPLLRTLPGADQLTIGQLVLRGLIRETGLARAERRLLGLGRADRLDQEWVIRATLATRGTLASRGTGAVRPLPPPGSTAAVLPDQERLLAAACGIADQLVVAAQSNGRRVNWPGLEPLDGRVWAVLPQGAGLPYGYCGTALFLAQLAALTGVERYAAVARRAVTPVPTVLAALAEQPTALSTVGPGYAGLGGIAYALSRLAPLLGDPALDSWLSRAVDLTAAAAAVAASPGRTDPALPADRRDGDRGITGTSPQGTSPVDPTVIDGRAGCLAAMLAVHEATGSPRAATTARLCADQLAARAVAGLPDGGLDTGAAGIGWALLRYGGTGGARYTAAGLAALAAAGVRHAEGPFGRGWSDGPFGTALALADSWADLTGGRAAPVDRAAASVGRLTAVPTGLPGPATVRSAAPDWAAALVARAVATAPALDDHSLCHGETGALELMLAATATGQADPAVLFARAGALLAAIDRSGTRCGTPHAVVTPGLFNGLAGIGYGLLRLGFGPQVPSALLMRWPAR